ncbi:MAG: amino acid adenylation domain-containing protein [Phycisphaerales bacterium]|nr:amino acid adenylation domain-containing protein [Phycisphaerales bacterium]
MTIDNFIPAILSGPILPDLLQEETLATMFRHSVKLYADKIACEFADTSFSYKQLDQWSDAVAAQLIKYGIGNGSFVGVWWPRGAALHAIIIGIAKCGAAYVPLDREMPEDRVWGVLTEVGARFCFSDTELGAPFQRLDILTIESNIELKIIENKPRPDDIAYVLYTSGSTGKPKGIPITHRMICHLVRSENEVIQINSSDKVYQGFSVSFDMWCEEVWISYFSGATLFIADATQAKSIDELSVFLRAKQISVLHAVPSLLAVMDENIPSIRLVNAGGEACTAPVIKQWATQSRLFFNSYGPTETTVTASMAVLKSGDKISIGVPLPNYHFAVLDEQLNALPFDTQGELVITGIGVSNGYINRPDLTAEKFIVKPKSLNFLPGDRIYKTGDAVSISEDGTVSFFGRLDNQVKLRGYRIELGEIENQLSSVNGIRTAVLALKKDNLGNDHLIAYAVLQVGHSIADMEWRAYLSSVLPAYMVPETLVVLPEMPRLPNGKTDRKKLSIPEELLHLDEANSNNVIDASAPLKERVLGVLENIFVGKKIDIEQDFFNDLGGHSLLAASFVSKLRKEGGFAQASLKDVYLHRPISKLLTEWESKDPNFVQSKIPFNSISKRRHLLCWIAQSILLAPLLGLYALQIFSPFLSYYYTQFVTDSHFKALLASILAFILMPIVYAGITIATKWIVIGKYKEGDYPLWGSYYLRWWLVKRIQALMPTQLMIGTPLFPRFLRLMGANVASNAQLSNITIGAEDLVSIAEDVSISSSVVFDNAFVEDGLFKIRKIRIDNHAYLGTSSIIGGDTHIEEWGELGDLSFLPEASKIAHRELWKGSPALKVKTKNAEDCQIPVQESKRNKLKYGVVLSFTLMVFPVVILLPLLPIIITLSELDNAAADYNFNYVVIVPVLSLIYILLFVFETIVINRLLMRNVHPGMYSVYSVTYWRKWLADTLFNISLVVLHPLFASVYVAKFYRALGATIGKNTEISTASNVTHTLLEIGDGSFVADAVTLGEADVRGQQLILEKTSIGKNTFVGNSANVPQGTHLPDNMLLGVLSQAPENNQQTNGSDWFGSPAIALPRRQESICFDASTTTNPSRKFLLIRALIEGVRIILPESLVITMSIFFIAFSIDIISEGVWYISALVIPFFYLMFMGLPSVLITALLKWIVVGRHKKEQVPLYSYKVWRSEAITTTYEALSIPYMLEFIKGTAWLPIVLRLFGVKMGKRVYMDTCDITEPDLVTIGDEAALNQDCGPQTHLFEDRVMKTGTVYIGARSTVRARTIILYDSIVSDGVHLAPLSLVMKGEVLEPNTRWSGSPVRGV